MDGINNRVIKHLEKHIEELSWEHEYDQNSDEKIYDLEQDLDQLEAALFEEAGGQRTEFAIGQLRMMQNAQIQPGLIPLSSEQEEGLADILSFAQSIFGGMADTRDGFASDIEGERN